MTSAILDDKKRILDIDNTTGAKRPTPPMLKCATEFAEHWEETYKRAKRATVPTFRQIDNVILCGMGGSAIAGDLLRSYLGYRSVVPFEVCRNYRLPGYASTRSLVILSSYSGRTEETISAYKEALVWNCQIFVMSGGSEKDVLKRMAQKHGHGHFDVDIQQRYQPRAALAFSFVPLLVFFERWQLAPPQEEAVKETIRVLKQCITKYGRGCPASRNNAKKIARKLRGKLPVIYTGVDHLGPVANRWQTQINENSKMLAHMNILPEMNHNEILGWPVTEESIGTKFFPGKPFLYADGKPVRPQEKLESLLSVVYLLDRKPDDHPRTLYRFQAMEPILKSYAVPIQKVRSRGVGLLARMFSLISLGDFVSIYLAILNGINPSSMTGIDYLKGMLRKFEG